MRGTKMRTLLFLVATLVLVTQAGCGFLRDVTAPTLTPTEEFHKQPEPQRPLAYGEVTGVPTDTLVIIHIQTPAGWESVRMTQRGSGLWQAVVTAASGLDYIITAEAEGYGSDPISYTIHLEGQMVYLVDDGHVTDQEAVDLDFDFKPR
jgi:hypothetical protein